MLLCNWNIVSVSLSPKWCQSCSVIKMLAIAALSEMLSVLLFFIKMLVNAALSKMLSVLICYRNVGRCCSVQKANSAATLSKCWSMLYSQICCQCCFVIEMFVNAALPSRWCHCHPIKECYRYSVLLWHWNDEVLLCYRNVGQCRSVAEMFSLPPCQWILLRFSAALWPKCWRVLTCNLNVG